MSGTLHPSALPGEFQVVRTRGKGKEKVEKVRKRELPSCKREFANGNGIKEVLAFLAWGMPKMFFHGNPLEQVEIVDIS